RTTTYTPFPYAFSTTGVSGADSKGNTTSPLTPCTSMSSTSATCLVTSPGLEDEVDVRILLLPVVHRLLRPPVRAAHPPVVRLRHGDADLDLLRRGALTGGRAPERRQHRDEHRRYQLLHGCLRVSTPTAVAVG